MRPHLATLLDDFRHFGGQTAIVRYVGNRRRATSYAELARLAGRFAALLEDRGVVEGDRVLLWAENSAEWIAAYFGCMLRGVLVVPLDAYGSVEFALRVAADVRPSLVVGDVLLIAGLDRWPRIAFEDWSVLPEREAAAVAGLSHDTPLQVLFTSGTTSEPKGIVHTHGNVLSSVEPIERGARPYMRYERLVHPLRFLHTLPLSHVFGQTMGLWVPAIFAAEVHFESRLVASRLIETIHRERISVLAGVPRLLAVLRHHLEAEDLQLPDQLVAAKGISAARRWWRFRRIHRAFGLKFWAFVTGGGALPADLEQFWNGLGFVLVQGYGMTETTALITLNHPFHVARGSIGKPLPGREVKLGPDGEVLVRGPMISSATWRNGAVQRRTEDWLATGDLAATEVSGEMRFLGRKSEVIVTASGVNLHPEDLEAALDRQPEVAASVVLGVDGPFGAEPCAVMVLRGAAKVEEVLARANRGLAEFQHLRRWAVWPEPDLPRTSSGKVRRPVVAAWLRNRQDSGLHSAGVAGGDWLLTLIASIAREHPASEGDPDQLRLEEDLRLDSLGRVQLLSALEQRFGATPDAGAFAAARTVGELRRLTGWAAPTSASDQAVPAAEPSPATKAPIPLASVAVPPMARTEDIYPRWPWALPFRWLRISFQECLARPLTWLLAAPRVSSMPPITKQPPMLIIANHISSYDVPLLLYGLPRAVRDRTAVAMSGEMLGDFRHARGSSPSSPSWLEPLGPLAWLLITALYNVFPLPRLRGFQRSFDHAGAALDHGYHVLVFPEGARSPDGALARFRPGIGLLARQSGTAVLPVALVGLGALKQRRGGWFRSGTIEIRVGAPLSFSSTESEAEITARLHEEVARLLGVVEPRTESTADPSSRSG